MRKILLLTWELYPYWVGGLGKAVKIICDFLKSKGFKIYAVLPFFLEDYDLWNLKEEDIYMYWTYSPYFQTISKKSNQRKYLVNYAESILKTIKEYANFVLNIAKNIDFDLIYAHDWVVVEAVKELLKIKKKPVIFHIHSTHYNRTGGSVYPLAIDFRYEKEGCEIANKVICVSNYVKNIVVNNYKVPENKVEVVYNYPMEISNSNLEKIRKKFKEKYKIVLYVGRLSLHKGVDWLLRAAKLVLSKRKDVLFVIVGGGEHLDYLLKLTYDLGIESNVIFTGRISSKKVKELFSICDVFVMPSVSEPYGLTPLEAITVGKPVIISKQSGISEVLRNAIIVDFWDTVKMANCILALLEYKDLRDTLVKRCKEDFVKFDWNKNYEKITKVINEILS